MEESGPDALCGSSDFVPFDSGLAVAAFAVAKAGGAVAWSSVSVEGDDGPGDKECEEQDLLLFV